MTQYQYWFYNGFDTPKLLGTTRDVLENTTLTDSYQGDKTEEMREELQSVLLNGDYNELKDTMRDYDIFVNPTRQEFEDENRYRYGMDRNAHLSDLKLPFENVGWECRYRFSNPY